MATPLFLTEGGLHGHMDHLYDNPDLTFSEMKGIFRAAATGKLVGTEKTDGQNLYISYSVKDGKAKAARAGQDIKAGGLDAKALAKKFAGRGTVEAAFVDAFSIFEKAVRSLSPDVQKKIFGEDADIYYNAEIQDPRNRNVINYDTKTLNIHRVGHHVYDKSTGKPVIQTDPETGEESHVDVSENFETLQDALEDMQASILDKDFRLQVNAIRQLNALSDDRPLNIALNDLEKELSKEGVSDNHTVGYYLASRLRAAVRERIKLPMELEANVVRRLMGHKGKQFNLNTLRRGQPKEIAMAITELVQASKVLKFKAIKPIENIVHEFAVEMMKVFQSIFVLDNRKEVKRLQDELQNAIDLIKSANEEETIDKMVSQFKKMRNSVEGVNTAAEGFVFDYNGRTYKFTGNFAPMNQILGMVKPGYSRSKSAKTLKEEVENIAESNVEKIIAIYPGRFQPAGRHHRAAFEWLQTIFGEENTFVATSGKVQKPKSPFNFSEKQTILSAHGIPVQAIVETKNPYKAEEITGKYDPDKTAVVYMVGKKDMEEDARFKNVGGVLKSGQPSYFQDFEKNKHDLRPLRESGYIIVAPHVSLPVEGFGEMSGTVLRQALGKSDANTFKKIMGFYDEEIHQLIKIKLGDPEEERLQEGNDFFSMDYLFSLVDRELNLAYLKQEQLLKEEQEKLKNLEALAGASVQSLGLNQDLADKFMEVFNKLVGELEAEQSEINQKEKEARGREAAAALQKTTQQQPADTPVEENAMSAGAVEGAARKSPWVNLEATK